MHAIGTSHNCFACIQMDEVHMNRHHEIAELIVKYKATLDGPDASLRRSLHEIHPNIPRPNPRARHNVDLPNYEHDQEQDDLDVDFPDDATITSASTPSTDATERSKLSKADARAQKRAAKASKSTRKALKNQATHLIQVSASDVEFVSEILHGIPNPTAPETHPLASDATIEDIINRNIGYCNGIKEHKQMLMRSIAAKRKDDRARRKSNPSHGRRRFGDHDAVGEDDDDPDETETLLFAVLTKLGVEAAHIHTETRPSSASSGSSCSSSRPRSAKGATLIQTRLVDRLKTLVKEDLEKHENEQRETCVRAGAFWRYCGKPVFNRMTKIAGEIDWKTGRKIKTNDKANEKQD